MIVYPYIINIFVIRPTILLLSPRSFHPVKSHVSRPSSPIPSPTQQRGEGERGRERMGRFFGFSNAARDVRCGLALFRLLGNIYYTGYYCIV